MIGHQFGDLTRQLRADFNGVNRFERSRGRDILNDVVAGDADIAQIIMIAPDCGDRAVRSPQRISDSNHQNPQRGTRQKGSREVRLMVRANRDLAALTDAVLHADNRRSRPSFQFRGRREAAQRA